MQRRGLQRTSRRLRIGFWVMLALMIAALAIAFFDTRLGQTVVLACCGGIVLLIVIGLLSERGMRR
jgi:hypothetical protein